MGFLYAVAWSVDTRNAELYLVQPSRLLLPKCGNAREQEKLSHLYMYLGRVGYLAHFTYLRIFAHNSHTTQRAPVPERYPSLSSLDVPIVCRCT